MESVYTGNRIEGSNPSLSATMSGQSGHPERVPSGFDGDVAQLGERLVRNEEVDGSIPFISTNMCKRAPVLMGPGPVGLSRRFGSC